MITHETTYTYTTTRIVDGTPSLTTRKETITNYEVETIIRPTVPTIIIKSVRVNHPRLSHGRSLSGHSQPGENSHSTGEFELNVPTTHLLDTHERPPFLLPSSHSPSSTYSTLLHPITPTPVTYYTTFTYFTTELSEGQPVVRSREQVISTVIRGKVLPTRVGHREQQQQVTRRPLVHRSKRSEPVNGPPVALLNGTIDESHSQFNSTQVIISSSSSSSNISKVDLQSLTSTSTTATAGKVQ